MLIILITLIFINSIINHNNTLQSENYLIKIDYPDLENKKEYKKVAKTIKKYIEEKKTEFIENVKDLNKDITYEFQVSSTVNIYKNITTINMQIYSYTGGAHYIREDKSFYIDENGNEKNLSYFLKSRDAIKELSELSYHYIVEYGKVKELSFNEDMVKDGTSADFDNFQHFSFKDKGLELLFPPYQVSCWADGEIRIVIPYEDLENLLKNEFIKTPNKIEENDSEQKEEKEKRDINKFKDKKLIAFTFDDGPSSSTTNKLLDSLDKFDARVTFFVLGSRVNQYKNSLKRAYEQGNQIGSHTYSHLNLFKLNESDIAREINNTNTEIKNIIGVEPELLRPPYGNINSDIKRITNMYTILWDIDPEDWKYKDKDKIAKNIVDNAHDGAIVLLHDIYESSIDGALIAMERLKDEGYAFVTIEEMIKLKNIEFDKTKSYFQIK